jgi:sugar/nucleoside kinase (ribokinase family)
VTPDLVVLGNLLVDDVVFADGRTRMAEPGGATLYASLGAALWGVRVGIASVRGEDYPASALTALAARGIDLSGVRPLGRPGLRTWLLYEGRRRQVILRLDGPGHAEVSPAPEYLPGEWRQARAFHLAPMPLAVQRRLVEAFVPLEGALISVDPYLPLRAETLEAWREVLARVDALFLSEDDLELPGASGDARDALRQLAGGRLRLVAFKRGRRGGMLYDVREERFAEWSPRAEAVVDPTGAGDAFAGGFLAGWLQGLPAELALRRGVVAASFALEEWGSAALFAATPEAARQRLSSWFGEAV